jgi:chromate transporter
MSEAAAAPSLVQIGLVFLRLGCTAFGGPAAHIAMMKAELVERRKWISGADFVDLLGAASLIPGPNSTELALHIGYKLAGFSGLFLVGVSFILPAFLLVSAFAAVYVKYGSVPVFTAVFYGLKPVILAIVFQAVWQLSFTTLKNITLAILAFFVVVFYCFGVSELVLLFASGLLSAIFHYAKNKEHRENTAMLVLSAACTLLIGGSVLLAALAPGSLKYSLSSLALYFLKLGSVLYGSGYVLLAFLRTDLVERYHWLSTAQLLDAVAVGQLTPGPLFTTATFVGYLLGGEVGAIVATVAIFLPGFVFVALTAPLVKKMRASALAAHFLDAVNAAALALMATVLFRLGRGALIDWPSLMIALLSAFLLVRYKINSLWLMLLGALVGLLIYGR